MIVIGSFLAGVLSFVSPCVLPMVPVYLSYLSGVSVSDLREGKTGPQVRRMLYWNSIWFILGFSSLFIVLFGSGASLLSVLFRYFRFVTHFRDVQTGEWFWDYFRLISPDFYAKYQEGFRLGFLEIGGLVVIIFGLTLLGVFRIPLLMRYAKIELKEVKKGALGAFLIGAAFGLGWTPCVGPILASIMVLAATEETFWAGIFHLVVYSAGMAVPFLLLTLGFSSFLRTYQKWSRYTRWMEVAAGGLLIFLGLLLVTNEFQRLNAYIAFLNEWIPLEKIESLLPGRG